MSLRGKQQCFGCWCDSISMLLCLFVYLYSKHAIVKEMPHCQTTVPCNYRHYSTIKKTQHKAFLDYSVHTKTRMSRIIYTCMYIIYVYTYIHCVDKSENISNC